MFTVLMVVFLVALAALLIAGAAKARRPQRTTTRPSRPTDHRDRLTDEDRRYLEESLRNAEGAFPQSPEVALDVAHNAVASVLHARGIDSVQIPAKPEEGTASPDELRRRLLEYTHIVDELTGRRSADARAEAA